MSTETPSGSSISNKISELTNASAARHHTRKAAVIAPSGRPNELVLQKNLGALLRSGWQINEFYQKSEQKFSEWPFTADSIQQRSHFLNKALCAEEIYVFSAKGGYGSSDLLPNLNWHKLAKQAEHILIGFSDVTALQWALHQKLGWRSVHGPMPATSGWQKPNNNDKDELLKLLSLKDLKGSFPIVAVNTLAKDAEKLTPARSQGKLLGGCLSVLTSLIGTPYFGDVSNYYLFFEDINESPPKILRMLQQWHQNGAFSTIKGLILGTFEYDLPFFSQQQLVVKIGNAFQIPVWWSPCFGHGDNNQPLVQGAYAQIQKNQDSFDLRWQS